MFDPETGEALYESRAPEIRAGLAAALEDYLAASGTRFDDPVAFRSFLRSTPEHAQAEEDLETLARLLRKFQILGLSSGEFAQARLALVRLVRPAQGINDQQFIAVIDAGEQGPVVPPTTDDIPIEADPAFQDVLDQQSPAGTAGTP
jgi:hypothetical protein